jgi:hypothetical protein
MRAQRLTCFAAVLTMAAARAAAQAVQGGHALALAAGVGWYSPDLAGAEKAILLNLAGGKPALLAKGEQVTVTADAVVCRRSDVAAGGDSCDLTFGMNDVDISGRRARTLYDVLRAAGAAESGTAGSIQRGISSLSCVVDKDRRKTRCLYHPR